MRPPGRRDGTGRALAWVLAAAMVAAVLTPLLPMAGAALPVSKAPTWVDDVQGEARAVAVCKGEPCGSTWIASGTANTLAEGDQNNLYSHSKATARIWDQNPSGGVDFAMADVDVNDDGSLLVGLANQQFEDPPLSGDMWGPYWVYETDDDSFIVARGDGDSIQNAGSDMQLVRWVPGNDDLFAMAGNGRVWLYEATGGGGPYSGWEKAGTEIGGTLVDLGATREYLVVANNSGGDVGLTVFSLDDDEGSFVIHKNKAIDGAATALDVARDANFAVVSTDDQQVYLVEVNTDPDDRHKVAERTVNWDIDDVAIDRTGEVFAFAGSGGIQVYRSTGVSASPLERLWLTDTAASELSMSPDGRYLAASDGNTVRFYLVDPPGDDPVVLWENSGMAGSVVDLETGFSGDATAVATNDGSDGRTYLFALDHAVDLSASATHRQLDPGQPNRYALTLTNAGDAYSDVELTVDTNRPSWVRLKVGDAPAKAPPVLVDLLPEESPATELVVEPPAGTAAGTSFTATVTATVTSAPGTTEASVDLTGTVRETHGVAVEADRTTQNVRQGGSVVFNLTITNTGNLDDTIDLTHSALSSAQWRAFLGQDVFPLEAGSSALTTLTVQAPAVVPQGHTEQIVLTGTSRGDRSQDGTLEVAVQVGRTLAVGLSGPARADVRPGQDNAIPVTVQNLGNAGETFEVDAQVPTGWGVRVDPSQPTVAASSSRDVQVVVTPPPEADGLATLRLTATSLSDPAQAAQTTVELRVDRGILGLAGPEAPLLLAALAGAALLWGRWARSAKDEAPRRRTRR